MLSPRISGNTFRSGKTRRSRLLVQACFALFAFLYLYVMQGEYVSWSLSALTSGQSHHAPLLYALIGSILCGLLQCGTSRLLPGLPDQAYALTALPSAVILVLLTAYPDYSAALIASVAALMAGGVVAKLALRHGRKHMSAVNICTWNTLILFALFLFVGLAGNTHDVLHYELRTARLLVDNKPAEAAKVGSKSLATSPQLTALRALALSKEGKLPENLFRYALSPGGCRNLLLTPTDAARLGLPQASPGALMNCPAFWGGNARQYFDGPVRRAAMRPDRTAQDYRLCALLLDKDIDRFASELRNYYELDSLATPLPTAYREALILYRQLRTRPLYLYDDNAVQANFNDFETIRRAPGNRIENENRARREYGHTYWWYYFYG